MIKFFYYSKIFLYKNIIIKYNLLKIFKLNQKKKSKILIKTYKLKLKNS